MNILLQNFSDSIAEIYEAALEPAGWNTVLRSHAVDLDATKASMHMHEFAANLGVIHIAGSRLHSVGYDQATAIAYKQHFAVIDPYVNAIKSRFGQGAVGVSRDLIRPDELMQTEFYNDYGRHNEIFYVLWAVVQQDKRFASGLAFIRPKDAKEFSAQEVQRVKMLMPHLSRAFKLQSRVRQQSDNSTEMILKGVDRLNCAMIALDEGGRIMNYSKLAKKILDEGVFIRAHDSRLQAIEPHEDAALQETLVAASRAWKTPNRFTGDAIRIAGKSSNRLGIVAFPVAPNPDKQPVANALFGDRARVLVYLTDPSKTPPSRGAVLCSLYHLTATEARIADYLLQGLTIKEIAAEMEMSAYRVGYYLGQAMDKTGTSRQALLMQLMLTLPCDLVQ